MGLEAIDRVLPLPAWAAEVFEAFEVTAEVGTHHAAAHGAEGVLKIRVNLHLRENRGVGGGRMVGQGEQGGQGGQGEGEQGAGGESG